MHESKREGYIRRIGNALRDDGVKAGISLTHEAAQEILALLKGSVAKKGKWVGEGDGYADGGMVYDSWYCSECDFCIECDDELLLPNFCQHCGADMRGDQDE